MGIIKTKGIVIAEHNMGDFDKMVTILTPNIGKISCAARGARRPKSTLMAGTQLLSFGEFVIYKGNNSYSVNSADPIEIFYNVRIDLEKLEYVSHITKILQDVTDENQNTYSILQLYLNTIYMISETDMNMDLIISIFKIRLLCILGFAPRVKKCVCCDEKDELVAFSILDDGFKCPSCAKQDTGAITISQTTKDAIRYIVGSNAKKLFSFKINDETIEQLKIISKIYLNQKLEKEYRFEGIFKK